MEDIVKNKTPFHDEEDRQQRKNKLKEEIHSLNTDLKHLHQDDYGMQIYGYQLVFEKLNSLFSEISNDLIEGEQLDINVRKNLIEKLLINNPPHEKTNNEITHDFKITFYPDKFLKLKRILFNYQLLIFKYEDRHTIKTSSSKTQREI